MKEIPKKRIAVIVAVVAFALLAVVGVSSMQGGKAQIPDQDKSYAKTVVKAASNVLAASDDVGLTTEDSPATIVQGDPQFDWFFDQIKQSKGMDGLTVENCSFKVAIQSVTAATARGDSTQTNYRFTISKADMTVNGKHIVYDRVNGFSE